MYMFPNCVFEEGRFQKTFRRGLVLFLRMHFSTSFGDEKTSSVTQRSSDARTAVQASSLGRESFGRGPTNFAGSALDVPHPLRHAAGSVATIVLGVGGRGLRP
jgi:hypothetical protein